MMGSTQPLRFPPQRLELALLKLNEAEHARKAEHLANVASQGGKQSVSVKAGAANLEDNRWANVLPYDHALLPGAYLNACYIPSFAQLSPNPRSYIASQAPLPHTLTTFYSHIVKQNVGLVVNLTPFEERGRRKSDKYWPMEAEQTITTERDEQGTSFQVHLPSKGKLLNKELEATLYDIIVEDSSKGQEQTKQRHALRILHMTAWADFGEMDERIFDALLDMIEQQVTSQQNPIWVHCSAGIGRSGTVIGGLLGRNAGSEVLRKALRLADVPSTPAAASEAAIEGAMQIIDHERQHRAGMVQTPEQFGMVASLVGRLIQQR